MSALPKPSSVVVPLPVDAVNRLGREAFIAAFGSVAEFSPWVAKEAEPARPYADRAAMIEAFVAAVRQAPREAQLALLQAHPDLAGHAAIAGEMGTDSRQEQSGAGLDRLTPEEYARFTALNQTYRDTQGFPFILAVRGATKDRILEAFETRLLNPAETEFATALEQVCRIIAFRIEDRVAP